MIVKETGRSFEPHPEYTGRAVCVDVTPLKRVASDFGERDVFRFVLETELLRDDGNRWAVWTAPFTPSLSEKANLRKFLRQWRGIDLTPAELAGFDLESLIGQPASIVVVHEAGADGQVFDRIAACTPYRGADPLKPSGRYVRQKDRPPRDGVPQGTRPTAPAPAPAPAPRPTAPVAPAPAAPPAESYAEQVLRLGAVMVHVGKNRGKRFDQLTDSDIDALATHWLPAVTKNPNPSPDDLALKEAVEFVRRDDVDVVPF